MKKFLALILALIVAVSMLTACTGDPSVDDPEKDVVEDIDTPEDPVESDEPIEDEPEEEIPEVVIPEKVLKFTVTSNGTLVSKVLSLNIEEFSFPAGSTLEYDVLIENDALGMGSLDLKFGDGITLSMDKNSSIVDNANITVNTLSVDISDYALGKWYRREVALYDGGADSRSIVNLRFGANELIEGCSYSAYYDNIRIKDSSGNIVKEFTDEELAAMEFRNFGDIVCSLEVVDDPEPRIKRKTAEDHHIVEMKSVGKVSDGASVDIVINMNETFISNGIYLGAENSSYIESVNSYLIYKNGGTLFLYHLTDKVMLASSVPVINTVEELAIRCTVSDSMLNIYACEDSAGTSPKLIWSVPIDVENGTDFGEIKVSGLGFSIAHKEIIAEDKAQIEAKTVYDPDTMELIYMNASTDKNPLEYAVGENMIFDMSAYYNEELVVCPYLRWKIEADDGFKTNGIVDFTSGVVKVITECKEPGFVYIESRPAHSNKSENKESYYLTAGAGADIHDLKAVTTKPDDFEEFWEGKMTEIEAIEPVLIESVEVENEEYYIYYVKVDAGKYGPVTGKVAMPKDAEPGSLKLKLQFMGYGVGDAPLVLEPGYLTFGVNSHSIENGQDGLYYSALSSGVLQNYGFNNEENSNRETVYFLGMIMRDVQAVRYLMTSEYWNGVDVELEGGSQGGYQSVVTGALVNDYATSITAWAPAFCDWAGQYSERSPSVFPFPDYLEPLSYYETTNFASMIKCPVTLTEGLGDIVCRPAGISMLYDVIPTPKKITWVQNMTHGLQFDYCLTYTYSAE